MANEMKIVVVNGTMRRGSTRHITELFLKQLGGEVREFWLPRDFSDPCMGCFSCFLNGEETCPHASRVQPILRAFDEADLIVLQSPVYVMGMSGQMKCFLDHTGYRFVVHRPNPDMYAKTGLVISTTGGAGVRTTTKAMKSCLGGICVSKIYRYGKAVMAMGWDQVPEKRREKMEGQVRRLAEKVKGRVLSQKRVSLGNKLLFSLMRMMQKKNDYLPKDREYWEAQGWLGKNRPWK